MNRENWLTKGSAELRAIFFAPYGLSFETEYKVSVGWCRGSKKSVGECWSSNCSEAGITEMFISPALSCPVEALAVLLHEMIHAHLGNGKGHGKEFKKLCVDFGLAGRVTATYAEKDSPLFKQLEEIAGRLGEYPHKKLTPNTKTKAPGEKKGAWERFKSVQEDTYRCMVSPVSLRNFGIPMDPWGNEMISTKE